MAHGQSCWGGLGQIDSTRTATKQSLGQLRLIQLSQGNPWRCAASPTMVGVQAVISSVGSVVDYARDMMLSRGRTAELAMLYLRGGRDVGYLGPGPAAG